MLIDKNNDGIVDTNEILRAFDQDGSGTLDSSELSLLAEHLTKEVRGYSHLLILEWKVSICLFTFYFLSPFCLSSQFNLLCVC